MRIHTSADGDVSPISSDQILKGVETLKKVIEKTAESNAAGLSSDSKYWVQITLHKITVNKKRTVAIKLPHPIYSKKSEICFFTKDLEDKKDLEATEEHWQNFFKQQADFSPKVISVQSLQKNYKSYESRLQLVSSYDLFLADDRVIRFLPERLGKHFFVKHKFPLEVKVTGDLFPKRLDDMLSATKWYNAGHGDSSSIFAATSTHSTQEIAENVEAIVKIIAKTVDRGWENVRSIQIKTDDSLTIPLYRNEEVSEGLSLRSENEKKYLQKLKELEERRASFGLKRKVRRANPLKKKKKARKEEDENEKDLEEEKEDHISEEEEEEEEEEVVEAEESVVKEESAVKEESVVA